MTEDRVGSIAVISSHPGIRLLSVGKAVIVSLGENDRINE